jgi:hypothetical protein
MAGIKNKIVCCHKEERILNDASKFPSKYINEIIIFSRKKIWR